MIAASYAATTLSLLGLFFDILGALVLVCGVLVRLMTTFRFMEVDGTQPWHRRLPLRIARHFGSKDVRNTTPDLLGEYSSTFWGFLLLVLGFTFQALGQWRSIGSRR